MESTRLKTNRLTDKKLKDAVENRQSLVFDASGRDRKWYLGLIRRGMESLPSWDLSLETTYPRKG